MYKDSWYHRNKEKASEQAKARYQKNKERIKAQAKKWREENPERKKELSRKWYEENKERHYVTSRNWVKANPEKVKACNDKRKDKIKEYGKKYRAINKADVLARKKAYYEANKDTCLKKSKAYAENNKDKIKEWKKKYQQTFYKELRKKAKEFYYKNRNTIIEKQKQYQKNNPHIVNARSSRYRAEKDNRTPIWIDKEELWLIKEAYKLAEVRSKMFGFTWHVDHIIPLRGKKVSGLHVINNLQVIIGIENIRKNNKYELL